jgi:hypothetical protein
MILENMCKQLNRTGMHLYSPLIFEGLTASSKLASSTTRHRVQITRRYIPGDSKTTVLFTVALLQDLLVFMFFPELSRLGKVILDSGSE